MPGAVVDVYFNGDETDTATFVIADPQIVPRARGLDVVSPSPLGNTLIGVSPARVMGPPFCHEHGTGWFGSRAVW